MRRLGASAALALALTASAGCDACRSPQPAGQGDAGDAGALAANGPGATDGGPAVAVPLPRQEVLKVVNPRGLPAYDGPRGSVEGVVYVDGDPPAKRTGVDFTPCPAAEAVYGHTFRETAVDGGRRVLADAVVALTGYAGFVPETREAVKLVARDCVYERRAVTLTFGQRLEVENALEKGLITPMLDRGPKGAILGALPKGDPVKLYPTAIGRYLLSDFTSFPFLTADVFVVLQPLHAVTDTLGRFRIDGVPVGKLELHAMHPELGGDAKVEVTVTANQVAAAEVTVHHVKAAPLPDAGGFKPPVVR